MMRLFRPAPLLVLALILMPITASAQGVTGGGQGTGMTREDFADANRRGLNLPSALEDGFLGLSARGGSLTGYCLEYRQVRVAGGQCRGVAVYVDGLRVADPGTFLAFQSADDIERAQLLSGMDATTRFGATARNGALIIETRSGQAGLPSANTLNLTGLDWSLETQPYPWARVLASTFLVNAAGFAIGRALTNECFGVDTGYDGPYRCSAPASLGTRVVSLVLPSMAGSFTARWAGTTNRSRGRIIPSAILGGIAGAAGYFMYVELGVSSGSDTGKLTGALLLTVARPLITVLSDRIFRTLY
jgi:hypothetical protein